MANDEARKAVRALEDRLVEALRGEPLRGLPNLTCSYTETRGIDAGKTIPGTFEPFQGLRVLSAEQNRDKPVRYDDPEVLVLGRLGRLLFVRRTNRERLVFRAPVDEDLTADVLDGFRETVAQALEIHVERTEQREASLDQLADLARRLRETAEK